MLRGIDIFDVCFSGLFPDDAKQCPAFLRHKMYLISPKKLHENSVPFCQVCARFMTVLCVSFNPIFVVNAAWQIAQSVIHHCAGRSDISVSKINSVSITVLRIIGSFKFLLYFCFGKLFCFSFSFQFFNHFYFSFNFSFYFRFQVYYVEDEINSTNVITTGCDKISIPQRYLQFSAVTWNFKAKFYQHIFIRPMHT